MFICLDWSACVCSHSKQNSLQYLPMHASLQLHTLVEDTVLNVLDMNNGKLVKHSLPLLALMTNFTVIHRTACLKILSHTKKKSEKPAIAVNPTQDLWLELPMFCH